MWLVYKIVTTYGVQPDTCNELITAETHRVYAVRLRASLLSRPEDDSDFLNLMKWFDPTR